MTPTHDGEHLPCGAELALLVDQVAEELPPVDSAHQNSCGHCRRALAELEPLWGQVRELAREEVIPPTALVATVMQAVRAGRIGAKALKLPLREIVPQLVEHALLPGERGTLRIADSVIAQVIAREALSTPGVFALDPGAAAAPFEKSPRGVEVSVDESSISARILLAVGIGWSIPDVVSEVRQRVGKAVRTITGLDAVAVDVTVTDVRDE